MALKLLKLEKGDGLTMEQKINKLTKDAWKTKNTKKVSVTVPVVNKRLLDSANKDMIIYKLATELAEQLINENVAKVEYGEKQITVSVDIFKETE